MIDADNFVFVEPTVPLWGKFLCIVFFIFISFFCVSSNDKYKNRIDHICLIKGFKCRKT